MFVEANGIKLHVEQRGAGSPALLFLHYWGGSARTWQHVVDRLAPDFRTVTMDQRGWGQSGAPQDGYCLSALADDALAVIRALDLERFILVGHSMGGKVAQLLASRRPRGLVGMALVAPSPPSPMQLPPDSRKAMAHAYDSRDSIIAAIEHTLTARRPGPQDLETIIADSLAGAPAAREAWPLAMSQENIAAEIARIDVPVIVISGEHDKVDPPDVLRRELLPLIPKSQLHILPQTGHLSPYEAPGQIAALVRHFALSLA